MVDNEVKGKSFDKKRNRTLLLCCIVNMQYKFSFVVEV
jgi:hypothetical protein